MRSSRYTLILVLFALALAVVGFTPAHAVTTGTLTDVLSAPRGSNNIGILVMDWTSNQSGVVTQNSKAFVGKILRIVTVPDGTDAPDANYDVTLTDAQGIDIARGLLGNRHTSNTEMVMPGILGSDGSSGTALYPIAINGRLGLNVSNAGAANRGRILIYYEK